MRIVFCLLALLLTAGLAFGLTIPDIQYTTVAGDGTYPSPYVGQSVTVQGIVTGKGYGAITTHPFAKYFIQDPGGSAWSGIYVYDWAHAPNVGDKIQVTGTVAENAGFTRLESLTAYSVISTSNTVPTPVDISTGDLAAGSATAEQYEGVLVKIQAANVTALPNANQEFYVSDGSGACQIDNGFYNANHTWSSITLGQTWLEITGVVDYAGSAYGLNPRGGTDMLQDVLSATLILPVLNKPKGVTASVELRTTRLNSTWGVHSYEFKMVFNHQLVRFEGLDTEGTLSLGPEPTYTLSANQDTVTVAYANTADVLSSAGEAVLLKLLFKTVGYGNAILDLKTFKYNNTAMTALTDGRIDILVPANTAWLAIGKGGSTKNIFNPWLNETIRIEYGCHVENGAVNGKVIVRIYDVQGRLVATLRNQNVTAANGIEALEWNGRDRNRNLLPLGVYYCHVEIIDRVTGKSATVTQPIVVAANLK